VLVVRGRHDRIAPADWTTALAAAAPHGRAHTLPGGGHMLPITHAAALAAVIEEFVGTQVGRRGREPGWSRDGGPDT
jgi:pimeloyl-ACP methyl ester carboxylesterase